MKPDVTINFCVRSNFCTKEKTHPVFVSGRVQKTRGYIGSTDIQIPSDMKIVNNRCVGGHRPSAGGSTFRLMSSWSSLPSVWIT